MKTIIVITSDSFFLEEITNRIKEIRDFSIIDNHEKIDSAFDSILRNEPSIVFVDFDNPLIDNPFGFVHELNMYTDNRPVFIGVSKKTDLAYSAIKNDFTDYLLKPVNIFELRKIIFKIDKRSFNSQLCIKSYSDYHYIDFDKILYLKADNNTTDFFLDPQSKITAYKTLKYFENILPFKFARIHHSYIINTDKVNRINFGKKQIYLMGNKNIQLPFSKSYKSEVKNLHGIFLQNAVPA